VLQMWNTRALDGMSVQAPEEGTYTLTAVLAISEHWNTFIGVLGTQDSLYSMQNMYVNIVFMLSIDYNFCIN
jgi:hypothetical protein